jgi:hypothetical protein
LGFLIDELDDSAFQYVFQFGIIPFPLIKEVRDRGTVAGAVLFKIDSLPMISKGKDGYQYGHDMLHDGLGEDTA